MSSVMILRSFSFTHTKVKYYLVCKKQKAVRVSKIPLQLRDKNHT